MLVLRKHYTHAIFVAIFSSLFLKGIYTCFTYNESHDTIILKSRSPFYKECVCEEPVLSTHNLKWVDENGKEIPSGPGSGARVYTERGHRMLSLIMPSASPSLSGTYKCVSQDQEGKEYAISYSIDVYDPLYFIPANITKQFLISGQDSLIHCQARGHNPPLITWYKGKEETVINNGDKYQIRPTGLLIRNSSKEDEGEYRCTARVPYTGEDLDMLIQVEVMTPPNVEDIIADPDYVGYEGEPLTLVCKASGYPLPTYSWRRIDDQNATNTTAGDMIVSWKQDFGKLIFENTTMTDQGTYECIAKNGAGESRSNISIEVLVPPTITQFENITAAEGSTISIVCGAIGRPQPYINITYHGWLQDNPGYDSINEDPTYMAINLTIERVQRYHAGQYDCAANNTVGFDQKSMNLVVLHKPIFEQSEELIWGWEDKTVNLSCEHISSPPAILEWRFLGNSNLRPTPEQIEVYQMWIERLRTRTEHFLSFKPIKKFLYGTYECIAKNHLGAAKKIIQVKEGFRPPLLSKNQVNITEVAATSATFGIYGVEYEGPPLIGFTAEYDEAEKYNETHIHLNRTWAANVPLKIDKLNPKTTYQIKFAAINEIGTGPFGVYYTFETPDKSVPEPPTWEQDVEAALIRADNKILKLKSPEDNGDPIDYYAVKYCPVNDSEYCTEQILPPSSEIDLSHLSQNTSYIIEMVAHNSVGNSTPVSLEVFVEGSDDPPADDALTAGIIIGVAVIVAVLCILILDVILLVTRRKGVIASCVYKKNKKKKVDVTQSKDKKGLLKDNKEPGDALKSSENGHNEFEYNKSTGVITGKHSAV